MASARKKRSRPPPPRPAASPALPHWRTPAVYLALAAMTWAVFGQACHHDFITFDDGDYVFDNPMVVRGLTWKGFVWAFTTVHAANWHPLTWLSHCLDCQIYGLHPGGHHATSVLIHAATAMLLFAALRQMTGAFWRSAFVAAVFAIHPLRVESVAWVAERKDVLSGFFFILTIGAYVKYARNPRPAAYGLVILLYAFGLMCKPMLVTLPAVLLLLDYWPLRRVEQARKLVIEKLPFLALSLASCIATVLAQRGAIQTGESWPLAGRLGNAAAACVVYLGQMAWPRGLSVLYPLPQPGLPWWQAGLPAALLAGISWAAWVQRRARPWMLVGWAWYLVMLAPVAGIIQVGGQAHADRYTYLPQIGICIAVAWWAAEWQLNRKALGGLMAVVIVVLMASAMKQAAFWQNGETLWTHAIACAKGDGTARFCLADEFLKKGKMTEAISQYEKGLELKPGYAEPHYNLGRAYARLGQPDKAITNFQAALQIQPDLAGAEAGLGACLFQQGKANEAIPHFSRALEIIPDNAEVLNDLGLALAQQGRLPEAVQRYQRALEIAPNDAQVRYNLGNSFAQLRQINEAAAQYEKAVQINPRYAEARMNLGLAYFQQGRLAEAITQHNKALEIDPNFAKARMNLGVALFQAGRTDEAIVELQKAVNINPALADARHDLGMALAKKGNDAGAINQFEKALQINSANPQVQNELAWLLATSAEKPVRDGRQALQLAQQASASAEGKNPVILRTLAAAFAALGQFRDACAEAQRAISLAQAGGQADLAELLKSDLHLYQAGVPIHQ
ncbi:MAG TPA: tetratricopeptide repeat protein [Verrucomicrobiae bacterium]|jgi:tetratricopeptide (TPR) repeat protein